MDDIGFFIDKIGDLTLVTASSSPAWNSWSSQHPTVAGDSPPWRSSTRGSTWLPFRCFSSHGSTQQPYCSTRVQCSSSCGVTRHYILWVV